MKCEESYPQGSYEECQLDLGHRGDHEYFGKKWARPEPAEPNEDVDVLLSRAVREARAWGTEERSYPVVIERTQTYVIWVDADCEDSALKNAADDSWEIDTSKEMPIDGSDLVRRLDKFERTEAFRSEIGSEYGPRIQCPDCGRSSFRREWFHNPMRKCHGPIEWDETQAPSPRYRWYRKQQAHAGAGVAR
ncbi:hypothetical protein MQE23_08740 [Streptomyces sp. HP-A2021]|uniref:hypothetical protein n=1 Tax=Streptomyces sp. HP-A2021 TaxID=2927875 RepID=UPI001FAF5337|nr:hypothetical protein [Streptomyces sp. HP-A2021]UOB09138.1 hypothetical protein MQE23_08740 [Streptomyces sp. HP-A2021]